MKRDLLKLVLFAGALFTLPSVLFGAVVYNNTTTDLNQYYSSTFEFGDQVNLGGTERTLTDFSFYARLNASALGSQSLVFRFYSNNGGTNGAPGTLLFQSDPQAMALGSQTFNVSGLSVIVPNSFTWTVTFSNLAVGNDAGLLIYNPPTIGSSLNDFWQKDGAGAWSLMQVNTGLTPANFAARVTAVPEPGVFTLAMLGAIIGGAIKRSRRS
jgi:hypothetical protein